jgi:hypothetical protein
MYEGAVVVVIVCYVNLLLSVQSVPITTTLVKSNIAHGEDYSIHHYVINCVSDLLQVDGFGDFSILFMSFCFPDFRF